MTTISEGGEMGISAYFNSPKRRLWYYGTGDGDNNTAQVKQIVVGSINEKKKECCRI